MEQEKRIAVMAIIVENRDIEHFLKRFFDQEAFRRFDILKIDAAERVPDRGDGVNEPLRIGRVYLDIEHVDAGELLKENAFSLHDRFRGKRAATAQS